MNGGWSISQGRGPLVNELIKLTIPSHRIDLKPAHSDMEEQNSFAGVDIGGSQIKALAFAPDGKQLAEEVTFTSDDGTRQWLNRVQDLVSRIGARCPAPLRVGLAAPGLVA